MHYMDGTLLKIRNHNEILFNFVFLCRDRSFSFRFNTRAKCFAQNMTITSTPPVTPTAMKVIGLASNLNCNPANKVSLEQGDLKEVTKSTEVTTETTHDYTLSRSISVTAEQEVAGFTSGYGFSARSAHQLNFFSLLFAKKN